MTKHLNSRYYRILKNCSILEDSSYLCEYMPIAWVLIAFTMRKCLRIRVDFDVAASLKSIADIIWAFRGRKTSNK
jgi:hypothetical protein